MPLIRKRHQFYSKIYTLANRRHSGRSLCGKSFVVIPCFEVQFLEWYRVSQFIKIITMIMIIIMTNKIS